MVLERRFGCAGVDEAGRGPLAGPVVAAAVVFPDGVEISGLNDSKKLDAKTRAELALEIRARAWFAVSFSWPKEIDSLNILWASMAAMERAVLALECSYASVLVDGNRVPKGLAHCSEAVIKGDGKIAEIAAASILAKTARDAYMVEVASVYAGYGFDSHFGYPTPEHFESLRRLGPCEIHRRSFAPVRALLSFDSEQACLKLD